MCTALFGIGVLGEGTVLVATNRDEDPLRASEPPRLLRDEPRLAGGRDAVAGGTWLAVRRTSAGRPPAVAMLLNRFDPAPGRAGRRSRGLLTLDVAASADPRATAWAGAVTARYAPCSLVWLSPGEAWMLSIRDGRAPSLEPIPRGWHALAHHELDDPADPRTGWLAGQLRGFEPDSRAAAGAHLHALITTHRDGHAPGVCLHEGRAPTVSSARVWLEPGGLGYFHAQGRPCVTPFADCTALLSPAVP